MCKSIEVIVDIDDFKTLKCPEWEAYMKKRLEQAGIPISNVVGELISSGHMYKFDDPCDLSKTKYVWTPDVKDGS